MKIRLYCDEDSMDRDLVRALRVRGLDVSTALEERMIERSDAAHLTFAANERRVLYSFNRADFYRLHGEWMSSGRSHGGLILAAQQRYDVGEQMRRILRLAAEKSAEEMVDSIEFLSAWHQ